MKKTLAILLALLLALTALAGCSGEEAAQASDSKVYNVAYVVNGNLGDKSFFDSAQSGIDQLVKAGRITCRTPAPPSITIPASIRRASATTVQPSVTSGSSPASLTTPQRAAPFSSTRKRGTASTVQPFGVTTESVCGASPVNSRRVAPDAASAAQVPVV